MPSILDKFFNALRKKKGNHVSYAQHPSQQQLQQQAALDAAYAAQTAADAQNAALQGLSKNIIDNPVYVMIFHASSPEVDQIVTTVPLSRVIIYGGAMIGKVKGSTSGNNSWVGAAQVTVIYKPSDTNTGGALKALPVDNYTNVTQVTVHGGTMRGTTSVTGVKNSTHSKMGCDVLGGEVVVGDFFSDLVKDVDKANPLTWSSAAQLAPLAAIALFGDGDDCVTDRDSDSRMLEKLKF